MKRKHRSSRTLQEALLKGAIKFAGHVEVRGGYYHDMWDARMDGKLEEGAWLMMRREPNNKMDNNAILVLTRDGQQVVGYVAKEEAARLAPFMDIGVKMAMRVLTYTQSPMRITTRLYIKR